MIKIEKIEKNPNINLFFNNKEKSKDKEKTFENILKQKNKRKE